MGIETTLNQFRQHLPEVFNDAPLPKGWDEDWVFIPVDSPEAWARIAGTEEPSAFPQSTSAPVAYTSPPVGQGFPGALVAHSTASLYPPPDAWAFYLPYHRFHPKWWGVYLLVDGVAQLATILVNLSHGVLSPEDATLAARVFMYAHEAFHHGVESFATRWEVIFRYPHYEEAFTQFYRKTMGTDQCVEEALASAYAYRRVTQRAFRQDKAKRAAVSGALIEYMKGSGPGYRRATEFLTTTKFEQGTWVFAEEMYKVIVDAPGTGAPIWRAFPGAFTGIARVTSRVNYLVRRDSPLAQRLGLALRYLSRRILVEKLKLAKCTFLREGGSHEIWRPPSGKPFPVPRHHDVPIGTVSKIIKQAGLGMSYEQFLST